MMTRRKLLICAGCGALGGVTAAGNSARPPVPPVGIRVSLLDCNAFVIDPPYSNSPFIARHNVLDPRLIGQPAFTRFVAVLAPASAVVLHEMLRFETHSTIRSLPRTRLNPVIVPLMTDDADVLYVAIAPPTQRPGVP